VSDSQNIAHVKFAGITPDGTLNELIRIHPVMLERFDKAKIQSLANSICTLLDEIGVEEVNEIWVLAQYKCLGCGRDKFARPGAHWCNGVYQQRKLQFERLNT
jgi:hypothetical protein